MTPDAFTIQELYLEVGDGHELYIQEWGYKRAKSTILFLHGGPGGGCKDKYKQLFDPLRQRVVFFDQRGSGKSLPYGSLKHNTTDDLVGDIEKIAKRLKLNTFVITGGSWGSCLALVYALKHPHRVSALVLNGILTGQRAEIDWIDQGGFRTFFPEIWERFAASVPAQHRSRPANYHYARVLGSDLEAQKASAFAYRELEGGVVQLDDRREPNNIEEFDPTSTRIEMHYLKHGCFLPEGYILENAAKLKMPVWLVQGRYDFVCPPVTAYELSKKIPHSELIWTVSGHRTERESWSVIRTILLQLAA